MSDTPAPGKVCPMYATHFGLRESPFNNTPDPRYFHATSDHEEALACLIYAVDQFKGFVLLTGEGGAGKTLIARLLLQHFGDRISSAVINYTSLDADDLLSAICSEFRVELPDSPKGFARLTALQDFLLGEFASNRPAVLVIDEAQNLPDEAFEQLRMVGNLEADDAKLLQVVIVGQPELRGRFRAYHMRQLRQRIFRSFHLSGLSRAGCAEYIEHRLNVAGWAPAADGEAPRTALGIFDESAIDAIYQCTDGLPRAINTACDNALIDAYAVGRNRIDGEFMAEVIRDLGESRSSEACPPTEASVVERGDISAGYDNRAARMPADLTTDRLAQVQERAEQTYRDLIHRLSDIQVPFQHRSFRALGVRAG